MSETEYQQLEILNKHLLEANKDLGKEIKRLKEEYVMLQNASDEVEEDKDNEIARLTAESTKWESKFYDEAKKVDKAIEYINNHIARDFSFYLSPNQYLDLRNILQGSDKE